VLSGFVINWGKGGDAQAYSVSRMAPRLAMGHGQLGILVRSQSISPGKKGGSVVSNEHSKATTTLPGKVERVISAHPPSGEPEKAQIAVEGADDLYREIRVPNTLMDDKGRKVKLKTGDEVDVKIETDAVEPDKVPAAKGSS
jgi:hypothetical protein